MPKSLQTKPLADAALSRLAQERGRLFGDIGDIQPMSWILHVQVGTLTLVVMSRFRYAQVCVQCGETAASGFRRGRSFIMPGDFASPDMGKCITLDGMLN